MLKIKFFRKKLCIAYSLVLMILYYLSSFKIYYEKLESRNELFSLQINDQRDIKQKEKFTQHVIQFFKKNLNI